MQRILIGPTGAEIRTPKSNPHSRYVTESITDPASHRAG